MADVYLVTGATGFVGSWCVKVLLDAGHTVRGTVRDPESSKCDFLKKLDGAKERLTLVKADLNDDVAMWCNVVKGSKYVLHTASPFVLDADQIPKGEEEAYFMKPAVQGTEVVIKACIAEGVTRVVLTSSIMAINYGHDPAESPSASAPGVDESTWTNVDGLTLPGEYYCKSKTVAEKRAWDLVDGTKLELAVVNPTLVVGPFLSTDTITGSKTVMELMLLKKYPLIPDIPISMVDVRGVAKMHMLAAQQVSSEGKRFLANSTPESISMRGMSEVLDEAGYDVPTGGMPYFLLWTVSWLDRKVVPVLPTIGKTVYINPKNGNELMQGQWIDYKKSLKDMAISMERAGIGKQKEEPVHRKTRCSVCLSR